MKEDEIIKLLYDIKEELKEGGVLNGKVGVDGIEPIVADALREAGINLSMDGRAAMAEARLLKTEDEIEMERPAITSQATAEAPVGRRMAPGGELSVKMNPELTSWVEIKNLIKNLQGVLESLQDEI